jgi:ketosteroid isomerase-like protein
MKISVSAPPCICVILVVVSSFRSRAFSTHPAAATCRFRARALELSSNSFGDLLGINKPPSSLLSSGSVTAAEQFIQGWNTNQIMTAMELVDDIVKFEDTNFPGSFSKKELERYLRFQAGISDRDTLVVDGVANDRSAGKIGVLFHTENSSGAFGKKGAASFELDPNSGKIRKVFLVKENSKGGEANLKVLRVASSLLGFFEPMDGEFVIDNVADVQCASGPKDFFFPRPSQSLQSSLTLPEQYFAAWNERNMIKACSIFSEDCEYDDTAFPSAFIGKEALQKHLRICADCFPSSFRFSIDDQIIGKDGSIFVQWHVENDDGALPFTRGCSFYRTQNGKITKGTDFVEPPVFKTGHILLNAQSTVDKLTAEPVRVIPLVVWATYIYIVFFSDWFYGLPATALEQRTWEEVRDLSLNFFLVSPLLHLPFAPVVHPMLEGVFNLLLSWAALFAGFLSDDRAKKPNLLPMLPMVAGMQFLTSAFLLPYLVTRSSETDDEPVYVEDLSQVAQVTESRVLAPLLTAVGSGSILWAIMARADQFGDWNARLVSFGELLRIDRVGSSFVVDLAIFAAFQGWFVDDDAKRRGMNLGSPLVALAKFLPFFGMGAYLTLRDSLPSKEDAP